MDSDHYTTMLSYGCEKAARVLEHISISLARSESSPQQNQVLPADVGEELGETGDTALLAKNISIGGCGQEQNRRL